MKKFRYIIISKKLCICAVAVVAALVFGIFTAAGRDKTLTATATDKKLPIYCTDKQEKIVSLSFDAAWGNTKKVQNPYKSTKDTEKTSVSRVFFCIITCYSLFVKQGFKI